LFANADHLAVQHFGRDVAIALRKEKFGQEHALPSRAQAGGPEALDNRGDDDFGFVFHSLLSLGSNFGTMTRQFGGSWN
jgi:hypothetical protein